MKFQFISLSFLLSSLALANGAKAPNQAPVDAGEVRAGLKLDGTVSVAQRKLIFNDLDNLQKLEITSASDADKELFGLKDFTTQSMRAWLAERAKVFVGQGLDLEKAAEDGGAYTFDNADELPDLDVGKAMNDMRFALSIGDFLSGLFSRVQVVMANVGSALYLGGKMEKKLVKLKLSDGQELSFTSARVGLIQVGQGLFSREETVNVKNPDAISNSIGRLETYFHESRHGDGHGLGLGFLHAICPPKHSYAGYNACDANLNGPYTVGAAAVRILRGACKSCTAAEQEQLKAVQLDSEDRVLKSRQVPGAKYNVDAAKKAIAALDGLLSNEQDPVKRAKLEEAKTKLQAQVVQANAGAKFVDVASENLDPAPEGHL